MSTKLLTEKEVSENYGVKEATLRNHRVYGKGFKFVKLGRKVLYRREDIEDFLNKHTFQSTMESEQQPLP